ncbi:MAG: lantibiotic biosynthesis protein, partial [Acidobacteriota bacterium]|nr:lantibiotic biosynthesis protein [Acidobacteriota bacterium]
MTHEHRAGSFFVLRTPLLPFETLLDWTACGPDEDALLARLRELARSPEIVEAVMLASQDLSDALAQPEPPRRVLLALSRYVCRMASRPTPFAMFAGYSVGTIANEPMLELPARDRYIRRATAGLELLVAIAESLSEETRARAPLLPTSTWYALAGQLRYVEERGVDHPLRATRLGRELRTVLDLARRRLAPDELAAALAAELSAPVAGARGYVEQLVANQILVRDLQPSPTADDPAAEFAARLHALDAPQARALDAIETGLRRLEQQPPGSGDYAPLRAALGSAAPEMRLQNAIHVVLHKPAPALSLDGSMAGELLAAAELLRRMFARPELDPLYQFREQFLSRYEIRFAPLLEVLDEELGIGLAGFGESGSDDLPLLADLP